MSKNQLPQASPLPLWLQKIQLIIDPLGYMDSAYQRSGDIFQVPVVGNYQMLLLVSNPEALKQIFTRENKEFKSPGSKNYQVLVGKDSLLCSEGDRHQRKRKLLMPPFHGVQMRGYGEIICKQTEQLIGKLTYGTNFSARAIMQELSLEVILRVVFGLTEGEVFHRLKKIIISLMEHLKYPFFSSVLYLPYLRKDLGPWSPWGYFCRIKQQIDQLLYEEISHRRQQSDFSGTDILSLMMLARDEEGKGMSDQELRDELITLLIAGHETTANSMAWALYWIHKNPDIRNQLLEEIDPLSDTLEPMTINRLPYLTAVCYETLRIYPVLMLTTPREVKEPVELMGYQLETGTGLYGAIYLTHHREDLYPQPQQFKPERFLERQFSPYEFLPFGGGKRRCIGDVFALFEMKLVLATILSRYELALADNLTERPQRRWITTAPSGGVKMILTSRH